MRYLSIIISIFVCSLLSSCGTFHKNMGGENPKETYPSMGTILDFFRSLNECGYSEIDRHVSYFMLQSEFKFVDSGSYFKIEEMDHNGKYAYVYETNYYVVGSGDKEHSLVDKKSITVSEGLAFVRDCSTGHNYLHVYFPEQMSMRAFLNKAKKFGFERDKYDKSLFHYTDNSHYLILDLVIQKDNTIVFVL